MLIIGAVGANNGPEAAAELEGGDEPGLVHVETPTGITKDLEALLHQVCQFISLYIFIKYFKYLYSEQLRLLYSLMFTCWYGYQFIYKYIYKKIK